MKTIGFKKNNDKNDRLEKEYASLLKEVIELIIDATKKHIIEWKYLPAVDFTQNIDILEVYKTFVHKQMASGLFPSGNKAYYAYLDGYHYFCFCLKDIELKQIKPCVFVIPSNNQSLDIYDIDTEATTRLYNILRFTVDSERDNKDEDSLLSLKLMLNSLNNTQSS